MVNIQQFVNAVIPWAVAIVGLFLLYRPLKPILDPMFRGIANGLGWVKRRITGEPENFEELYHVPSLQYE